MEKYDTRIDAYIAKSAEFAKPILNHLRELIHSASPKITETVKWGMPFFEYKGPVCHIAAFKQHCAFGFWKAGRLKDPHKVLQEEEGSGAGSFGRIISLSDLPSDEILLEYIHEMIALNESGVKEAPVKKAAAPKAVVEEPAYLTSLLDKHPDAKANFEKFSPSQKREYLEWIVEAKTDATRQKRLDTAIEWISEGKTRHWKYK
ncbi:hypothetical protein EOD41_14200 [Mucilaginibacter limnophilus]|uniref:YdhG-like domain-containing protein n=1 Tax=Mucilaginibacter limnophilus TaxID=1932778 RepID=A0A3S2UKS6_9SPHI|nr:YdeI/OmpD-associated family protein [Mucilaginibacter limnophilus]RVU00108.1 hypothetical protein EOD41_14200 [Mucilaginibacter limnophilus]